jgi:hypothetical protein
MQDLYGWSGDGPGFGATLAGAEEVGTSTYTEIDVPPSRSHVWIALVMRDVDRENVGQWYEARVGNADPTVYQFMDQFRCVLTTDVVPENYLVDNERTTELWKSSMSWGIV